MPTTAQVGFSFMPGEFAQKLCFVIFNLKLLAIGCTCVGVSAFQLKQLGKVEHLVAALIAYVEVNNHIKTNTFRFNSTPTTVPETPYNVPENVQFPSRPMLAYANLSVQQSHLASNVSNLPTAFNPNATVQYNLEATRANATSALSYTGPPASLMGATEAERIDARMLTKNRIASPMSSTTASTAFHEQTVSHARNTISLHTREAHWKNVSLGDNSTVTPIPKVPINSSEAMPLAVNQQSKSQSNLTLSADPSIAATTEQKVQKLNNREKSSLSNDNLPPAVIEVATEINASNASGEPTSSSTKEMLQRKAGSVTSTKSANGVQVTNIHKLVTATIPGDASTKRKTTSLVTSPIPLISADKFGTSVTVSSTTFAFATVNIPPQTKASSTENVYRYNQTTLGTSTTVSLQQDYGKSLVPRLQKVTKSREVGESRSRMNDPTSEVEQLTGNERPSVPESTEDKDSEDSVTDGNREVLQIKGNEEQYNSTEVIEVNVDELLTSPLYSANVTDSPVIRVDNISTIFATSSLSLTSFSSSTFSTVPLFPSSSLSSTSAANSTVSQSSVTSPSSVTFPPSATSPSATAPPSSLMFLSSATFLSSPSPPYTVTSQSSAAFLSSPSPPSTMTSQSSAASPSSVTFASSANSPSSTTSPSFASFPSSETYSSAASPTSSLTFPSSATSPSSTTTPSFATSTSSAMFSSSPSSTTSKTSLSPTLFISPTLSPSSPPTTLPSSSKSYSSSSTSVTSPSAFTIIMSSTPTNVTSSTPSTWATASTSIHVVVTTETPKLATETRDGLPSSTSANERPGTVTRATMEAKTITKAPSKRRTPNWSSLGYAQGPLHRRKRADEHHAFVSMVANIVYGSLYTSLAAGIVLIFSSLTGFCGGLCKVIVCLKISIIGGLVIIIFELGSAGIVIYAYDAIVNGPEHSVLRKAFNLLCQSANFCMNPTVLVLMGVFFCIAIVVQIASLTLSYRIVQDASKPEQEEMFSYPAIPNYPILMSDLNRHPMAPHQSRIGRGRMEQMGGMYSMGGMMPNQMIQNPMMANFPNPNMAYTTPMVPTAPQPQAQPVTVFQPTMSVLALQPASVPMCCHSHSHSHQHVTQAPSCHQCRSYSIITI